MVAHRTDLASGINQQDEKARQFAGRSRHFSQFPGIVEVMRDACDKGSAHICLSYLGSCHHRGMAPWIEESRHAESTRKAAKPVRKLCLTACKTKTTIRLGTSCSALVYCVLGVLFVLVWRALYGRTIGCVSMRELELFRLLKSEPYLLKSGRDRLSQRYLAFAM